jgi:tRNA (uracil-5-)-methyltransferase TRM9
MDDATVEQLLAINRKFYSQFGAAFAATRRRIQDGVSRVLDRLPDEGRWLDLGCGSGALASEWVRRGRKSSYLGLDFSQELLDEARAANAGAAVERIEFRRADLGEAQWSDGLGAGAFNGALIFAALHHLPSRALRLRVLREVRSLLQLGGWLVHSEWQFQNSPKLMERRQPWEAAGLNDGLVDAGDTLLDWRFTLPGQKNLEGQTGLRYVHLFTLDELADLAKEAGFRVLDTFESDGQGGRLSVYQVWQAG